jgi:hypothetical protein
MTIPTDTPDLPDGLYEDEQGNYYFFCERCEAEAEWPEEPEAFEESTIKLCGGSPRCCP